MNTTQLNELPQYMQLDYCQIAYRIIGQGEPLVFITGWPFNSNTYHNLVPLLADDYTCILLDSPGLGETLWDEGYDFTFPAQARTFQLFLEKLAIPKFNLIAHNTGATIARLLVADNLDTVNRFIILNTEIPQERPPWLPLYTQLMKIPGTSPIFRGLLHSRLYLQSSPGFGGCYHDKHLINDDFINHYIQPLITDPQRLEGARRYLTVGLDFQLIDALSAVHQRIACPVHFIWGAADRTFPIDAARRMMTDFPNVDGMTAIPQGKLLSHEEFPQQTATAIRQFLSKS